MKVRRIALYVALAALVLPAVSFAGAINPGQWQATMETEMPGMPMKVPALTFKYCITPEQAENPEPPKGKKDDCKIVDYKLSGNTATWKVSCEKQKMEGTGTMTLNGDSYTGETHMKMGDMDFTQKMTGKRLGSECAK